MAKTKRRKVSVTGRERSACLSGEEAIPVVLTPQGREGNEALPGVWPAASFGPEQSLCFKATLRLRLASAPGQARVSSQPCWTSEKLGV